MIIFLNGKFVSEEQAVVSVSDRGFLYGDGLFETLRVHNGRPFRWPEHLERLTRGAACLGIPLPFSVAALRESAARLARENNWPHCLLRIVLSRGVGLRGYSPKGANQPTLVMSLHPAPAVDRHNPPAWRLITASTRLFAQDPLACFKTCNKLPQILARAEADAARADDALLLNDAGHALETTCGNLFWIDSDTVGTPPLVTGVLPGVTRAAVLELCPQLGLDAVEREVSPAALREARGVFLTLSSWGVVEVVSLDGQRLNRSALCGEIRERYWKTVTENTA